MKETATLMSKSTVSATFPHMATEKLTNVLTMIVLI